MVLDGTFYKTDESWLLGNVPQNYITPSFVERYQVTSFYKFSQIVYVNSSNNRFLRWFIEKQSSLHAQVGNHQLKRTIIGFIASLTNEIFMVIQMRDK